MNEIKEWAPTLLQIPVVAAFIVFTTWMLKAFLEHLKFVANTHLESMASERKQRMEAMDTGLREVSQICAAIEKLAVAITENNRSLVAHNAEASQRHAHLLDVLRERDGRHN